MTAPGCNYVALYLERLLDDGERAGVDLDQVSAHAGTCPACYTRLAHFFRTIELPESSYLRETLDELALALYNLAKAIIRDRPDSGPEDSTENVHITEPIDGSAEDNIEAADEMIGDAEDYAGSSHLGEMNLEKVRDLLADTESSREMKIDLALSVFRAITQMESRSTLEAWNFIGVLHYQRHQLDEAEAAFLKVLGSPEEASNVRALTHCNLAYIFKHRGDLDRAIRSAERAIALAGVDGKDPYFGRFAAMYFHLLRGAEGDVDRAREQVSAILELPGGEERLRSELRMQANEPVRDAFSGSILSQEYPALVTAEG